MPFTRSELVRDARTGGFTKGVSERLVADWAGLGLLEHPAREARGAGQGPGARYAFSDDQGELFLALLRRRGQHRDVRRLCDVVVGVWLYREAGFISTSQVRRALGTWIGLESSGMPPNAVAEKRARRALEGLLRGVSPSPNRRDVERLVSSAVNDKGWVNWQRLMKRVAEAVGFGNAEDARRWVDGTDDYLTPLLEGMASIEIAADESFIEARTECRRHGARGIVVAPEIPLSRWLRRAEARALVDGSCESLLVELGYVELERRGMESWPSQSARNNENRATNRKG